MSEFFKNAEQFNVEGATVPFYKFSENGVSFVGFDSRPCVPPEPMMNALLAIKFADKDTKNRDGKSQIPSWAHTKDRKEL